MSTAVVRKTKLNRKWTLWEVRQVDYRKQTMSARAYMTGLHAAFTFDCVEDFWRCFNNYPTPSAIFGEFKDAKIVKRGEEECVLDGLALFEDGVQPMFEDIKNKNGSEWRFVVVCPQEELDELWLRVCAGVIGESLHETLWAEINGVRLMNKTKGGPGKAKAQYRVEFWLKSPTPPPELKEAIAEVFSVSLSDIKKATH